jgi:predicted  nucleic acid-binding Zn-ribbon protein
VYQTTALYQLQIVDSKLDTIRNRLKEIDKLLGENEVLQAAVIARDSAQETLRNWKTRQADLERELQQLKDEAKTAEERLYSGRIHNHRELEDLQNKLAELNRRIEGLGDPSIEAMLEIEEATEQVRSAQADLDRVTEEHADQFTELAAEREQLLSQHDEKMSEAEQKRVLVEAPNLRLYDSLRKRPGGNAVATLNANAECSVCGVQVTSSLNQQVRRGEVIPCPTCGRILYRS